jgi:hypothetical protein
MRNAAIVLMLIGIGVVLTLMWVAFPSMLVWNIIAAVATVVWAVWLSQYLTD